MNDDNFAYLKKIRESSGIPYSKSLELILPLFSPSLPEEEAAKARLTAYCEEEIRHLMERIRECKVEDLQGLRSLTGQLLYFRKLLFFLTGGEREGLELCAAKGEPTLSEEEKERRDRLNSFDDAFPNGCFTVHSDKVYRLHEAIAYKEKVGRTLTKEEMAMFEVKDDR